ncbi:unnamed protein product [Dicrocoelium dendriticum]|nr:unnamed protein product [Dicrocoelium dendriticum]
MRDSFGAADPTSAEVGISDPQTRLISPLVNLVSPSPSNPVRQSLTGLVHPLPTSTPTVRAAPSIFSPWMHHSILDQALGGLNRSPEWHASPASRKAGSSTMELPSYSESSPKLERTLPDFSGTFSSGSVLHPPQLCTASTDLLHYEDFDRLTDMLGQVTINDASTGDARSIIPSKNGVTSNSTQRSLPISASSTSPVLVEDGISRPYSGQNAFHPANNNATCVTDAKSRAGDLFSGALERSCCEPVVEPVSTADSLAAEKQSSKCLLSQKSEPSALEKMSNLTRSSICGMSDMFSHVTSSLIDHIGGVAHLAQPVSRLLSIVSDRQSSTPSFSTDYPKSSQSVCLTKHSSENLMVHSMSLIESESSSNHSMDRSVEADVWKSLSSIQDATIPDTSDLLKNRADDLSDDKENVDVYQTDINQVSGPRNASFTGPYGDVSSCIAAKDEVESCIKTAREWGILQEEVCTLRDTINELSSIISQYEKSLMEFTASEHNRKTVATERILRVAQERDEAFDQASTMYKAYDDMVRRIQRAQETIEVKKNKQMAVLNLWKQYERKCASFREKMQNLYLISVDRLSQALSEQDQQRDFLTRKIDRLDVELKQHQVRKSSLLEQIEQLQKNSEELRKMNQQLCR